MVLHAQPAHYVLDGAHGVGNPRGLHAERLAVAVHVMEAETGPLRNLMEAVQNAHLNVEGVVGAGIATGHACLSEEERELGVAMVDFGAEVTHVSVHVGGILVGMSVLPYGSGGDQAARLGRGLDHHRACRHAGNDAVPAGEMARLRLRSCSSACSGG